MKNIGKMMKNIQGMQKRMQEIQDSLVDIIVEGSSGGDMVSAKMNCHFELKEIEISDEVLAENDKEMLQDLIVAAVNDAQKKASEKASEEMGQVTGGLNIPGLDGLI